MLVEHTREVYNSAGVFGGSIQYGWSAVSYDYYMTQTAVIHEYVYHARIPSYEHRWFNCTDIEGDCTYASFYYNDYTGS